MYPLPLQDGPTLGMLRIEEKLLWRLGVMMRVADLGISRRSADANPIGGTVAGARETLAIDECLQQHWTVVVCGVPVLDNDLGAAS